MELGEEEERAASSQNQSNHMEFNSPSFLPFRSGAAAAATASNLRIKVRTAATAASRGRGALVCEST